VADLGISDSINYGWDWVGMCYEVGCEASLNKTSVKFWCVVHSGRIANSQQPFQYLTFGQISLLLLDFVGFDRFDAFDEFFS